MTCCSHLTYSIILYEYRYKTLFYCGWFYCGSVYCASQILCFLRIEGLWQQHWASLLVPFFQQYLLTSCLSHFGNFPTIFVLVASGQ